MCIMALMTDAPLPPDGKREVKLDCADCGECVKSCPAGSYDLEKTYPESYDMRTCARNRHKVLVIEIEHQDLHQRAAFAVCAVSTDPVDLESRLQRVEHTVDRHWSGHVLEWSVEVIQI